MTGNSIDVKTGNGSSPGGFGGGSYDHEARDIAHDIADAVKEAHRILGRAYSPYGAYPDTYTQEMLSRDQVPIHDIVEGELRHEMDLL